MNNDLPTDGTSTGKSKRPGSQGTRGQDITTDMDHVIDISPILVPLTYAGVALSGLLFWTLVIWLFL